MPPPTGFRYVTVAHFDDDLSNASEAAWSLVLESSEPLDQAQSILADVNFLLSDKAPWHLLALGHRFKLFEGKRMIATGEIVIGPHPDELNGTTAVQQKQAFVRT